MEQLSGWEVYLIMQADSVRLLLGISVGVLSIAAIALSVVAGVTTLNPADKREERAAPELRRFAIRYAMLPLSVSVVASCVMPSTKTLCAIYVVPAIVNNEELRTDGGEIYELAVERLKDALGEKDEE